jgi:RNA polymerase sigma-70 factor (ECF subfamily)
VVSPGLLGLVAHGGALGAGRMTRAATSATIAAGRGARRGSRMEPPTPDDAASAAASPPATDSAVRPRVLTPAAPPDRARATELMGHYCDGEAAAFHALYALLAPRLLSYLVGLVGDRASGEDLLQHTFIKIHEARAVYVRGADPVPWAYTIAHRTALDELRRRRRARTRVTADGELPEEPRAELTGVAEGAAAPSRDTLYRRALAALDQLPENQRQALLLTKVHGRTHAEAAAILGSTPGAVKLRAHRAYVALRRLLGADPLAAKGEEGAS